MLSFLICTVITLILPILNNEVNYEMYWLLSILLYHLSRISHFLAISLYEKKIINFYSYDPLDSIYFFSTSFSNPFICLFFLCLFIFFVNFSLGMIFSLFSLLTFSLLQPHLTSWLQWLWMTARSIILIYLNAYQKSPGCPQAVQTHHVSSSTKCDNNHFSHLYNHTPSCLGDIIYSYIIYHMYFSLTFSSLGTML